MKGQRVVCVDDQFTGVSRLLYVQLPKKGSVYTVRAVYIGRSRLRTGGGEGEGEIGVLLEELQNPRDPTLKQGLDGELGFKAERFAPFEAESDSDAAEERQEEVLVVGAPWGNN